MLNTIYFGTTGSGTAVVSLNVDGSYTISCQVDQATYPHASFPNQWFTLSPNSNGGGLYANICGGGTVTSPTTYFYNGGNADYDIINNVMSTTFFLPDVGVTVNDPYGSPFTIATGPLYILPYVASGDYGTILPQFSYQITALEPLVCFKSDTKILTNNGYVHIQDLRKGDLVKTLLHDYKPIYMIGKKEIYHAALEERVKDQLYKLTQEQYPELSEDLVITGCHCILVDKFKDEEEKKKALEVNGDIFVTNKKYRLPACADEKTSVYDKKGKHIIYHLALENEHDRFNYGIYANGLLVETCSKHFLEKLSNMEIVE
jgi:hypothetical protein